MFDTRMKKNKLENLETLKRETPFQARHDVRGMRRNCLRNATDRESERISKPSHEKAA